MSAADTWVFFALETSGPDPSKHSILEVAAIAVEVPSGKELERFDVLVLPPADMKVCDGWVMPAWSPERFAAAELEDAAIKRFDEFLCRHASVVAHLKGSGARVLRVRLAGHGASKFDFPHVLRWFRRHDRRFPADPYCMDTAQLFGFLDPQLAATESYESLSVDALARKLYLRRDERITATTKARMAMECAREFWQTRSFE